MVTIKDIAEKAGVSSSAVSRALRNDPSLSISNETRLKIFASAGELKYKLKKEKEVKNKYSVLVIHYDDIYKQNPVDCAYYTSIRNGIEETCNKKQINCFFVPYSEIEGFNDKIDGIILAGNYTKDKYQKIINLGLSNNFVAIGTVLYYGEFIDQITYSNRESVKLALDYLIECGHKKIGYLGAHEAPDTPLYESRIVFFKEYLNSKNLLNTDWILEGEYGYENGYKMTGEWIKNNKQLPTAIFIANDPNALGSLKAFNEHEIKVPDDISIISFDGNYPTQYSYPALTTTDVHTQIMGQEAVFTLMERMKKYRKVSKKIIFAANLIVRDSVNKISD